MTPLLHWAQSNELLTVFLVLAVIYILREIFLKISVRRPFLYYSFLFPGIIIHELSHLILCLITFARVKDIKLFSKTGGFVEHETSRIPFLGNFLISIAPFLVGSTIIFFLSSQIPTQFVDIFTSAKYIGIFYFLLSILITFFPSRQDITNSPFLYIASAVILGFALSRLNLNTIFTRFLLTGASAIIILIAAILIMSLINSIFSKIIKTN